MTDFEPAIDTCPPSAHSDRLISFGRDLNVGVIGASGGIGSALVTAFTNCPSVSRVISLSRFSDSEKYDDAHSVHLDILNEDSVAEAVAAVRTLVKELHIIVVTTGVLHIDGKFQPEKTFKSLDGDTMEQVFRINTVGPSIVAKHFLPILATGRKSVFAVLSARVGSIDDNRLGGWHSYRASKAALNMVIKTVSIELAHRNPTAICVTLHPGTVDTALSEPFQRNVREDKLFSPTHAAGHLLGVFDQLEPKDTGGLFAWDGARVPF